MRDERTKKLPDGRKVVYISEFLLGYGRVIEAHGDELIRTRTVPGPKTRQEIEERFTNLPIGQGDAER
jgi:hypothetical protein